MSARVLVLVLIAAGGALWFFQPRPDERSRVARPDSVVEEPVVREARSPEKLETPESSDPETAGDSQKVWSLTGRVRTWEGSSQEVHRFRMHAIDSASDFEEAGSLEGSPSGRIYDGRFVIQVPENKNYRLAVSAGPYFVDSAVARPGREVEVLLGPGIGFGGLLVDASKPARRPTPNSGPIGLPRKDNTDPHFRGAVTLLIRVESNAGNVLEYRERRTDSRFSFGRARPDWWKAETSVTLNLSGTADGGDVIPLTLPLEPGQRSLFTTIPVIPHGSGARPLRIQLHREDGLPRVRQGVEAWFLGLGASQRLPHSWSAWFVGGPNPHFCHVFAEQHPSFLLIVPPGAGSVRFLNRWDFPFGIIHVDDGDVLADRRVDLPVPGRLVLDAPLRPETELHNLEFRRKDGPSANGAPVRFWHVVRKNGLALAPGTYVIEHVPRRGPNVVTFVREVIIRSGETTTLRFP